MNVWCVCVCTDSCHGGAARVYVWVRQGIKDLVKWILSIRAPNIMFLNEEPMRKQQSSHEILERLVPGKGQQPGCAGLAQL